MLGGLAALSPDTTTATPLVEYLRAVHGLRVFVLIPEVEPAHLWQRVSQNHRGSVLAVSCVAAPTWPSAANGSCSGPPGVRA